MRGFPLLRLGGIVGVMALMSIPLLRFTCGRVVVAPIADRIFVESVSRMEITATSSPFPFVVKYLGKVIWQAEAGSRPVTEEISLNFPPEGIELGIEGQFSEASLPAAIRLRVTPNNGLPIERVVWASGPVDEILLFQP